MTTAFRDELAQIAAMITSSNILHQKSQGDLSGWCERIQKRLREVALPINAAVRYVNADGQLEGPPMLVQSRIEGKSEPCCYCVWIGDEGKIHGGDFTDAQLHLIATA